MKIMMMIDSFDDW